MADLEEQLQRYRRLFASSASRLPDGGRQLQAKMASLEKEIANAEQTSGNLKPVPKQPTEYAGSILLQSQLLSSASQQIAKGLPPSGGPAEGQAVHCTVNKQPAVQHQSQVPPDYQPATSQLPPTLPAAPGGDLGIRDQPGASSLYHEDESAAGQAHVRLGNEVPGITSDNSLLHSLQRRSGASRKLPPKIADGRMIVPEQQGLSDSADLGKKEPTLNRAADTREAHDSLSADDSRVSPPRLHRQQEQASRQTPKKQAKVLNDAMMTPFPDEPAPVVNQVRSTNSGPSVFLALACCLILTQDWELPSATGNKHASKKSCTNAHKLVESFLVKSSDR